MSIISSSRDVYGEDYLDPPGHLWMPHDGISYEDMDEDDDYDPFENDYDEEQNDEDL